MRFSLTWVNHAPVHKNIRRQLGAPVRENAMVSFWLSNFWNVQILDHPLLKNSILKIKVWQKDNWMWQPCFKTCSQLDPKKTYARSCNRILKNPCWKNQMMTKLTSNLNFKEIMFTARSKQNYAHSFNLIWKMLLDQSNYEQRKMQCERKWLQQINVDSFNPKTMLTAVIEFWKFHVGPIEFWIECPRKRIQQK